MPDWNPSSNNISCRITFVGETRVTPQLVFGTFFSVSNLQQSQSPASGVMIANGNIAALFITLPSLDPFEVFFGSGFTQNLATITIQKSSLIGLNALPVNTAESLLVALLSKWLITSSDYQGEIQLSLWSISKSNGKQIIALVLNLYNLVPENDYVPDYSGAYASIKSGDY